MEGKGGWRIFKVVLMNILQENIPGAGIMASIQLFELGLHQVKKTQATEPVTRLTNVKSTPHNPWPTLFHVLMETTGFTWSSWKKLPLF